MRAALTALLLIAALGLAACGGDDDETTASTTSAAAAASYDITAGDFNALLEDEKTEVIQQYLEDNDCALAPEDVDDDTVFGVVANTTPPDAAPDDPLPDILAEIC